MSDPVRQLMKKNVLKAVVVMCAALGCFAVSTGDTIEIETYLNAHSSAKFRKSDHNLLHFVLKKGDEGKVVAVQHFSSGNYGLKIVVQDGPHKGQPAWVYFNPNQNPANIALVDKDQEPTEAPEQANSAKALKDTSAVQDPQIQPALAPAPVPPAPADQGPIAQLAAQVATPTDTDLNQQAAKLVANQNDVLNTTQQDDQVRCAAAAPAASAPSESVPSWALQPSSQVESNNPQIVALAQKITAGISDDRAKAQAIHDWIIGQSGIVYDEQGLKNGTYVNVQDAVTVLNQKLAVCAGFSDLNAALLRAAGIPAKVVYGQYVGSQQNGMSPEQICAMTNLTDGSAHGWNEVYVDGHWINEDITADAGSVVINLNTNTSGWQSTPHSELNFDPNPAFFVNLKCGDIQE
jgi:transglutaminase-like putative cysteine protease